MAVQFREILKSTLTEFRRGLGFRYAAAWSASCVFLESWFPGER